MKRTLKYSVFVGLLLAQSLVNGVPIVIQTGNLVNTAFVADGGEFVISDSAMLESGTINGLIEECCGESPREPVQIAVARDIFCFLCQLPRVDQQAIENASAVMPVSKLLDIAIACDYLQIKPSSVLGRAMLNRIIHEFGITVDPHDWRVQKLCEIIQETLDGFYQQAAVVNGGWGPVRVIVGALQHFNCMAFTANDQFVVAGRADGVVCVYNTATAVSVAEFSVTGNEESYVEAIACSPDGQLIATSIEGSDEVSDEVSNVIGLWNIATGAHVRDFSGHTDMVFKLQFSPDGSSIVSASADGCVYVWNVATGTIARTFNHPDGVLCAAFSADGTSVVTSCVDNIIRVWDMATGLCVRQLVGHTQDPNVVRFSHDGRHIMSVAGREELDEQVVRDNTVRIWDALTGTCQRTIDAHESVIYDMAVSFDDKFIISQSLDNTVRIWDTLTGARVHIMYDCDELASVAFAHTRLLAGVASGNSITLLHAPALTHVPANIQKLFILRMIGSPHLTSMDEEDRLFDVYQNLEDSDKEIVDRYNQAFVQRSAPALYDSPCYNYDGEVSGPE